MPTVNQAETQAETQQVQQDLSAGEAVANPIIGAVDPPLLPAVVAGEKIAEKAVPLAVALLNGLKADIEELKAKIKPPEEPKSPKPSVIDKIFDYLKAKLGQPAQQLKELSPFRLIVFAFLSGFLSIGIYTLKDYLPNSTSGPMAVFMIILAGFVGPVISYSVMNIVSNLTNATIRAQATQIAQLQSQAQMDKLNHQNEINDVNTQVSVANTRFEMLNQAYNTLKTDFDNFRASK